MNISEKIQKRIKTISEDTTFGYEQLGITQTEFQAAAKVIERLLKKGIIKKSSKGVFYKPRITVFGELKPSDETILRQYLFEDGKRIAYITGTALYNQLGLTTQMAFIFQIASRKKRIYINTTAIKAKPVKSYAEVTDKNYQLLGFLDAIKDIKIIPDTSTDDIVMALSTKINRFSESEIKMLVKYSFLYPARTRALLGAILESLKKESLLTYLKKSLNPLTKYKIGLSSNVLPTALNWNIK